MVDFAGPGILNAADYGMYPGNIAADNGSALQQAIDAAQASSNPNGAIVVIPSFTEQLSGPYYYGNYAVAGHVHSRVYFEPTRSVAYALAV